MLEKLLPAFAVAGGIIWICIFLIRALCSPIAKIPGPKYSFFTDLWLMKQEFTSNRREYIHQLHQQYGPVVRLGPNEVSFLSLEAIKEIYTAGGSGYDKTEFYTLFMQFGARTMFSTLWKGGHSQKKRHIASQYANTNIMRLPVIGGIQERVDKFIQKCIESGKTSMDVYIYLHCFALDCVTHHLFHPYGTKSIEREEHLKLMQELSYHYSIKRTCSQIPVPEDVPNFILENFAQYRWPQITTFFARFTKARPAPLANQYVLNSCEKPEPGENTLVYKLQNSKDYFKDIEIAAECMDHMAAGIDTTGDALCFLMYQLSLPESLYVQEKLFQEFQENKERAFDDLPYLEAVVKEGLRCFPPIPMSQPRYVPSGGRTIDGYFVPGGTIVSCQAWSVHRLNEDVYNAGDKFIPERWLDESKSLDMNRLFFAFGTGGRGCTGRHLAIAEMKCLLREVYSQFRTRVASDMTGSMSISDQIISSRPLDQTCKLVFERVVHD